MKRRDLNAVLHHARDVVRQTARVLDLQVGGDANEQSDDARYESQEGSERTDANPGEVVKRELRPVVPKDWNFASELE